MIKYDYEKFDPTLLNDNDIDKIQIEMIPNNSRILEIGCATGFMSEYLRKHKGCFIYGIEIDPEQAEIAKSRCDEISCGSVDEISLQQKIDLFVSDSGKFDIIFMSQVIEHIAESNKILVLLKQWIKEDGYLVISTVNIAHWKSRFRLLFGKWRYEKYGLFDETHLRFFSVESMEVDLKNAGYQIVDQGYHVIDFTPFYAVPLLKKITVYNLIKLFKLQHARVYKYYLEKFKNIIGFQFVYKAKMKKV